jgi:hypothetical protein
MELGAGTGGQSVGPYDPAQIEDNMLSYPDDINSRKRVN